MIVRSLMIRDNFLDDRRNTFLTSTQIKDSLENDRILEKHIIDIKR